MNHKQNVAYQDNGLLLSKKKELAIDVCNNMDKSQNNYDELKKL